MPNQGLRYYVLREQQQLGPFTHSEIVELHHQAVLGNDITLKQETTGETVSLDYFLPIPKPAVSTNDSPSATPLPSNPVQNGEPTDFKTIEVCPMDIFDQPNLAHIGLGCLFFLFIVELRGIRLPGIIYPILGIISGAAYLYSSFRLWSYARLITDIPTSKARSAAVGLVEVCGKARPINDLRSISLKQCIFYKYEVVTLDNQGHKKVTSKSNFITVPFLLEDETGAIHVDPHDAKVGFGATKRGHSMNWGYSIPYGYDMEYIEYVILPDEPLHIIGRVDNVMRPDGTKYRVIHKGSTDEPFLIFRDKEARLLQRLQTNVFRFLWLGLFLLLFSTIAFFFFLPQPMRPLIHYLMQ